MSNVQIITGNQAAALAAKLCSVEVVAAYPITPQSQLSEILSSYVESGELKAEYVRVEGEHSALTVCISASTVGARVFTATSANGLLYMHEQLHWAAGSRLPIVMCCVNRGVGAPWTIFNDQQDSLAQRDTGWIQLYCRNNQEIIDTVIQAYRIAESVYCPVMVCYDGFVLSHTMMPVDIPDAAGVRTFLPPYQPHTILSPDDPRNLNPVLFPGQRRDSEGVLRDGYMDMRYKLQAALEKASETIRAVNAAFAEAFGRDHGGMLWEYRTDDADLILAGMGSIASEATVAADRLREEGIKAGVVGIRSYRPFPKADVRNAFRNAKGIAIFEKSISYGYEGGLCSDLKAAFYGTAIKAPIHNYIAGLGGRDVKARELAAAAKNSLAGFEKGMVEPQTTWLNTTTG
ncbi:MAG: pyruvate ferredoxin oxidoreductase [Deltaproteobacteria bacterium HGW-Deltaproteobacteria-11]|nr:MAG: pyruvate ferredoxin oxidoreductase [Deltaproteobacteria bacterium HGW-Deltaproteobacteria-11]